MWRVHRLKWLDLRVSKSTQDLLEVILFALLARRCRGWLWSSSRVAHASNNVNLSWESITMDETPPADFTYPYIFIFFKVNDTSLVYLIWLQYGLPFICTCIFFLLIRVTRLWRGFQKTCRYQRYHRIDVWKYCVIPLSYSIASRILPASHLRLGWSLRKHSSRSSTFLIVQSLRDKILVRIPCQIA